MLNEAIPVRTERVRPGRPSRYGAAPRLDVRPVSPTGHDAVVVVDDDGPGRPGLAERWGRLRVVWEQTTFYLFSPDSWRR